MLDDLLSRLRGIFAAAKVDKPGHVGQANTPNVHMSAVAGPAMRDLDATGAEFDRVDEAELTVVSRALPSFRLGSGAAVSAAGDVALGNDRGTAANAHISKGHPDYRRTGNAATGSAGAPPVPVFREDRTNARIVEVIDPVAPPSRPRAGFTGADPTRAAQMPIAFTIRPFDKLAADHPGTVTKAGQPNPTAARPPQRKRLLGARPSALGSAGTGMEPITGHRDSARVVPAPLASSLSQRGTSSAPTARTNGWKLR